MFFSSLLQKRETLWKWVRIVIYMHVGWGIPFLFMVIPTSADAIGFAPGSTLYAIEYFYLFFPSLGNY